MKIRIEFPTVQAAIEHAMGKGGWISLNTDGVVRWYSPENTATPILGENPRCMYLATWREMARFVAALAETPEMANA